MLWKKLYFVNYLLIEYEYKSSWDTFSKYGSGAQKKKIAKKRKGIQKDDLLKFSKELHKFFIQ